MWLRPYWRTGQVVQNVVYPLWRGAVRALMAPEELLPCIPGQHFHLKPQSEEQTRRDCLQLHSHFSAPWKLLTPDHDMGSINLLQTLLLFCCQHNPLLLTTSQSSLSPASPAAASSVFMELLLCHSQPRGSGRASWDGEATPTLGTHTQPGAATAVLHQPRNLCCWLQVRWGKRTTGMSDI